MKNLLFITRKIDNNDERVSFVTDWILEFSKNLGGGKLIVICQEKGDTNNLPKNIEIYSLGKEKGFSKLRQIWNFQILIFKQIRKVRGVFSHMIQHYSILAGPWCKLFNKKLIQWYTHKSVNIWLKMANFFVDEFVSASKESFQLKTKKPIHVFGHGINIKKINNGIYQKEIENKNKFMVLSVGRISPAKNVDLIVKAVKKIYFNNLIAKDKILLNVVGAPGLDAHKNYYLDILKYVKDNNLEPVVKFIGPLPHSEVFSYYKKCDVFINLSDTGAIDKVNLEAMVFGKIVLTTNTAYKEILPKDFFMKEKNVNLLADKILKFYHMEKNEKLLLGNRLKDIVLNNHNLKNLAKKIIGLYN